VLFDSCRSVCLRLFRCCGAPSATLTPSVIAAARAALADIASVVNTPETAALTPMLLNALSDPTEHSTVAADALVTCEFTHSIDAPVFALLEGLQFAMTIHNDTHSQFTIIFPNDIKRECLCVSMIGLLLCLFIPNAASLATTNAAIFRIPCGTFSLDVFVCLRLWYRRQCCQRVCVVKVHRRNSHMRFSPETFCAMATFAKDLLPYMCLLLPELQQVLMDPIPDVLSTTARALDSLLQQRQRQQQKQQQWHGNICMNCYSGWKTGESAVGEKCCCTCVGRHCVCC